MSNLASNELKRVAILVLGMHRAGSSATTRFLNFLGCTLPRTLLDANPTNPAGHWESDAIRAFNDGVLTEAGSSWSDWLPVHSEWAKSQTYRHNVRAAGKVLESEFGNAPLFVLKDPRICRLAPFWYEVLETRNVEVVTLIPLRNPLEVAASLHKRDGMAPSIGQLLWLRHVLDAEFASRGHRRIFTHYEELLDDWNGLADRVGKGLGIVWPRSKAAFAADAATFLSHDLRHHVQRPADILENAAHSRWLRDTYAILLRWASKGEDENDQARLDAIRHAFDDAGENFVPQVLALDEARREIEEIGRDRHGLALRVIELTAAMGNAQAETVAATNQKHLSLEEAEQRSELLDQELAAVRKQLEQAHRQIKETDLRLDSLSISAANADAEALRWKMAAEQLQAELETDRRESQHLQAVLELKSADLDAQLQASHERTREIAALKHEVETSTARNTEISATNARITRQADVLANRLQEAEAHARLHKESAEFMRETLCVLAAPGQWWLRLLPAAWARTLKNRALQRKGLFDVGGYHSRYPDVAEAGSDALLHYVSHGLEEGRLRN